MNNITHQTITEKLIESTRDFLAEMSQIDKLIELYGPRMTLTMIADRGPRG